MRACLNSEEPGVIDVVRRLQDYVHGEGRLQKKCSGIVNQNDATELAEFYCANLARDAPVSWRARRRLRMRDLLQWQCELEVMAPAGRRYTCSWSNPAFT